MKIKRKARFIKVRRSERDIQEFNPAPTVLTRFSKKEYELRREYFEEEWGTYDYDPFADKRFGTRNYDDYVSWGALGGRPQKWESDAQRKKYERIYKKIEEGRPLKLEDHEFLKTLGKGFLSKID